MQATSNYNSFQMKIGIVMINQIFGKGTMPLIVNKNKIPTAAKLPDMDSVINV